MSRFSGPDAPPSWPTDPRGRLAATMAVVSSERGYAATRVTDVLQRTGISSRTFYAYFENREGCFFVAYDAIVSDLGQLLDPEQLEDSETTVESTFERVLEHFAAWPAHARVLLVEILCTGPRGSERHEQTMATLAARLAACPRWQPGRCDSLERQEVAQAVIGAITRMIQLRLSAGEERALPSLLPSLTALTTRVALADAGGATRARR
jgi:AcrR family transcriptional regulator